MKGMTFGKFLPLTFNSRMADLGFIPLEEDEFELIRKSENNSPLYHLAFYSKNKLGKKFWNESRKMSERQLSLNF